MWKKDELQGNSDQLKGTVKEEAGDRTDHEHLRNQGARDEAASKVQQGGGKARRKVDAR